MTEGGTVSSRVRESLTNGLGLLRHEPIAKRIRAVLGETTVVDTSRAMLVWEPRRVVPSYAVPIEDLRAQLAASEDGVTASDDVGHRMPEVSARPVLDPSILFRFHTAPGLAVDVIAAGQTLAGAGTRIDDPDLAGYVVLDFSAFDTWLEEDEINLTHPRDPFHRVDVLASSRRVRIELGGELLAESSRPVLLFETMLPTRYYLPREDVRIEMLPSTTTTVCAYKGRALYWSPVVAGRALPDLAWSYPAPLHEADHVRDRIAFFDEKVDVFLDGQARSRPATPWS
jgi:uncharacterized protein (DUF427 family)